MNKLPIFLLLILIAALSFGSVYSYANENTNKLKASQPISTGNTINTFQTSGEGNSKTQFKIKNNHNNENSEFMLKGVITASSSDSITIDKKEIKIDSSVTGDIKMVGAPTVNAYAMVKGIIIDSNKYAEKIIVNQRNKNNIEEEEKKDDDKHLSATRTPAMDLSITPTPTQNPSTTESDKTTLSSDLGNIIVRVQDFLNYLKEIASKI